MDQLDQGPAPNNAQCSCTDLHCFGPDGLGDRTHAFWHVGRYTFRIQLSLHLFLIVGSGTLFNHTVHWLVIYIYNIQCIWSLEAKCGYRCAFCMGKSVAPPTIFRRSIGDSVQLFRDPTELHAVRIPMRKSEELKPMILAYLISFDNDITDGARRFS